MEICKNCKAEVALDYCALCGQKQQVKIIDSGYLKHELMHLFHVEKGFLYTIKHIVLSPGVVLREYLRENRGRIMKPIPFLIFSSLLYTLFFSFTNEKIKYGSILTIDSKIGSFNIWWNWLNNHFGYSNIFICVFIGLFVLLFFRKQQYYFFEIITVIFYIMGVAVLFLIVGKLFDYTGLLHKGDKIISALLFFGFSTYALGNFFKPRNFWSYFKAFWAIIFGFTFFVVFVFFCSLFYDLCLKLIKQHY